MKIHLLFLLLLFACKPRNQQDSVFLETNPPKLFGYDEFVALIKSKKLRSVDSVLQNFPEELKENVAFVHSTRSSTQASSYEQPRAIVYNLDGSLVVTFNGSEKQKGGNRFEVAHFNAEKAEIELRSIIFDGKNEAVITKANDVICQRCHGDLNAYIWDSYSNWPDNYGADDDHYGNILDDKKNGKDFARELRRSEIDEKVRRYSYLFNKKWDGSGYFAGDRHNLAINRIVLQNFVKVVFKKISTHPKYDELFNLLVLSLMGKDLAWLASEKRADAFYDYFQKKIPSFPLGAKSDFAERLVRKSLCEFTPAILRELGLNLEDLILNPNDPEDRQSFKIRDGREKIVSTRGYDFDHKGLTLEFSAGTDFSDFHPYLLVEILKNDSTEKTKWMRKYIDYEIESVKQERGKLFTFDQYRKVKLVYQNFDAALDEFFNKIVEQSSN